MFIAGAVVQWLRDGWGSSSRARDVETLAASVPDAGGVVFVPHSSGSGRRTGIRMPAGRSSGSPAARTAAHIARAALESMAFQTGDVLAAMQDDAGIQLAQLKVDGGASVNNPLMQFQADLLGVPVVRPVVAETTALGAAYLAGLAVGFWNDIDDIQRNWALDREFRPNMSADESPGRCEKTGKKPSIGRWGGEASVRNFLFLEKSFESLRVFSSLPLLPSLAIIAAKRLSLF